MISYNYSLKSQYFLHGQNAGLIILFLFIKLKYDIWRTEGNLYTTKDIKDKLATKTEDPNQEYLCQFTIGKDSILGIVTDEDREKVFEPKFTTKSSGMGLGLPMVKNIVEAYNGTIEFTTEALKGTVFKVILPKQ